MDETIAINIRGRQFHLNKKTPIMQKCCKLAQLNLQSEFYLKSKNEYYFDRNPDMFSSILDYNNTGKLHYPTNLCSDLVKEELKFWELDESILAPCCWHRLKSEEESKVVLDQVRRIWTTEMPEDDELMDKSCRNKMYIFLVFPHSSKLAKAWSFFIMTAMCISIISYMIESIPTLRIFRHPDFATEFTHNITESKVLYFFMHTKVPAYLLWIEIPISVLLSLDFVLKFFAYKSKAKFIKNIYNIFDFLAIFPVVAMALVFSIRTTQSTGLETDDNYIKVIFALNTFRILRVLRLIRFAQHYKNLKLIQLALKSSLKELVLLLALLTLLAVFFANIIFLAELNQDNFWSITEGLWWAFITMTTVGYGDYYPKGVFGYVVGAVCAVMGILVIALPVPIVVSNFSSYYISAQMVQREQKIKTCREDENKLECKPENGKLFLNSEDNNEKIKNIETIDVVNKTDVKPFTQY